MFAFIYGSIYGSVCTGILPIWTVCFVFLSKRCFLLGGPARIAFTSRSNPHIGLHRLDNQSMEVVKPFREILRSVCSQRRRTQEEVIRKGKLGRASITQGKGKSRSFELNQGKEGREKKAEE
jgi:hypothetical protein